MKGARTSASRASKRAPRASQHASPAPSQPTVTIRDLEKTECERLLSRNHVGRIAFTFKDRVDIEPIGYVYSEGSIYARTSPGTKLTVIAHHPWAAFEVDEVRGPFDWESVVVKGTVYLVGELPTPRGAQSYEHARELLRSAMPAAFTTGDPVPQRSIVLRMHIDEWTGRVASIE